MATHTSFSLRNQAIYCIFVRDFTPEGTFNAVIPELPRIKALGTDIIWFLPFYPIGELQRKGSVGSPYAIKDYRNVDPAHGSIDDFKRLVAAIHALGMKVMIDIVYNHTAPDSWLVANHPEWFHYKADGKRGNKVGDWYDVVDLDYTHQALWDYQIETLAYWAEIVDGFRCDVAPLVPLPFWLAARERVAQVNPNIIWLAESVHGHFARALREAGFVGLSDGEIYQAFDMTYDYDVQDAFEQYVAGDIKLSAYINRLEAQDFTYPHNYIKMHYLENHDQPRAAHRIPNTQDLRHWFAMMCCLRGSVLVYNGQERQATHVPSLFEVETIDWTAGTDCSEWLATCIREMKACIPYDGVYRLHADDEKDTVIITHETPTQTVVGIMTLRAQSGAVTCLDIADGTYHNRLTGEPIQITGGAYQLGANPALFIVEK